MKRNSGFTLLEVMMTIAISATLMTSIFSLIYEGIASRTKAGNLETAIYLADKKMRKIYARRRPKTGDTDGEFEDYPGYSFKTEVREEELDLMKGIKDKKDTGASDEKTDNTPSKLKGSSDAISNAIKDKGMGLDTATGGIIPLTRITVTIFYNENNKEKKYELESYKLTF